MGLRLGAAEWRLPAPQGDAVMADKPTPINRHDLTFAQAEGVEPLPAVLARDELPEGLRAEMWDYVFNCVADDFDFEYGFLE